ncbi:hypothetical protein J5N97_008588 [Dioscorea zingiberensis]|uniref:lipoyl(octanoyl) transferase n=1 Tax=Dioscorea zingiberensis TaxID=325984 RepID=A0A9D5CXS0_9LILI|nr:hypothetical protein J5N97_008588 [Dioscorea zingiberensis]
MANHHRLNNDLVSDPQRMILLNTWVTLPTPLHNPKRNVRKAVSACHQSCRRCECYDLHKQLIPYQEAWLWQKSIVRTRHSLLDKDEDHSDVVIVLQHPPVFTLGTASSEEYLNFDVKNSPFAIHRTERGGEVTYHGPGQLVMYPIVNLRYHKMDLNWYLRSLSRSDHKGPFINFLHQGIKDRRLNWSLGWKSEDCCNRNSGFSMDNLSRAST